MLAGVQAAVLEGPAQAAVRGAGGANTPLLLSLGGLFYDFTDKSRLLQASGGAAVSASGDPIGFVDDGSIGGNDASQGTAGSKPTYTESGAQKYAAFDGGDNLLSTLAPATTMTLAACIRATAGVVFRGIIGSETASGPVNGCELIIRNTGDQLGYGWGTTSLFAGSSVAGTDIVVLFRGNAAVGELWLNGVRISQNVVAGSPSALPLMLGAINRSGSAVLPFTGRIYRARAIPTFVPDAALVPLMRALGRQADGTVVVSI